MNTLIDPAVSFYATQVNGKSYVIRTADADQSILAVVRNEGYGYRVILDGQKNDRLVLTWDEAMDLIAERKAC